MASTERIAINLLSIGEVNKLKAMSAECSAPITGSLVAEFSAISFEREANVETGKGRLFSWRGRFREAEAAYTKAEVLRRDALVKSRSWPSNSGPSQFESGIDYLAAFAGMAKVVTGPAGRSGSRCA